MRVTEKNKPKPLSPAEALAAAFTIPKKPAPPPQK